MYVDYEFYTNTYGGKIKEPDFIGLEIQASSLVDYYTFNRIKEPDEKVKYAVCELVDYLDELKANDGKEIVSETVGAHSVTYVIPNKNPIKVKQKEIINKYLGHTGLLYRGR